jgi:hypothetical protein
MPSARVSLLASIPYGLVVALLLGEMVAFPLLVLGWVIALVAADEPSLSPTTGRHADVGWFQRTALGLALTYRRGWVPMKAQPWVWPVVVGLLVAPGAALGWHEVGAPAGLGAAANFAGFVLASPVAVLAAGFVAENVLVQPLIAPFLALAVLGFLIATAGNSWPQFQCLLMGLGAFVGVLFTLDLVRLGRRAFDPSRGP